MLKRFLAIIVAGVVFSASIIVGFAYPSTNNPLGIQNYVDIEDVLNHPEKYPDVKIEIYETTDEYIETISQDKNIDEETREKLIQSAYAKELESCSDDGMVPSKPEVQKYLTFYFDVHVKDSYYVQIYFYTLCSFLDGPNGPAYNPNRLLRVEYANMDRAYKGRAREFQGTLYYNLESETRLFWDLNGDFFDYGTTSYTGGGAAPVGGEKTLSFSITYSNNHYAYCHEKGSYNL